VGKKEKLIERLKSNPRDFTFDEMRNALEALGFEMFNKGKTSGSRVKFSKGGVAVVLHKPHPRKELLEYQIKQILEFLEKENLI
jgi:predicted RNA binding protein YcfA (HicA-like mRNA interferase family)